MPWFGDFGILYYRKGPAHEVQLQRSAEDVAQLGAMAQKIQDGERANNPNFYGFVYQGNAYEGLTCDSLEWLASTGGGQSIDGGKVTINNPRAAAILNSSEAGVGKITPRGVTTYQEGESEKAFTAGNAAFMRNWPYAYAIGQTGPIKGKFDVTTLLRTGPTRPSAPSGAGSLGLELLEGASGCRRARALPDQPGSREVQRDLQQQRPDHRERRGPPGRAQGQPWLWPEIANVKRVTRPSRFLGTKYNQGSQIIYQGINQILNGQDANTCCPGWLSGWSGPCRSRSYRKTLRETGRSEKMGATRPHLRSRRRTRR